MAFRKRSCFWKDSQIGQQDQIYNSLCYCAVRSIFSNQNPMPRHKSYVRRPSLIRYVRPTQATFRKIARKTAYCSQNLIPYSTTIMPKIKKIRKLTIASRKSVRIAALPQQKPALIALPSKKVLNKKKAKQKKLESEYIPKKGKKLLNKRANLKETTTKTMPVMKNRKKFNVLNQTSDIIAQQRVTRSSSILSRRTRSNKLNSVISNPKNKSKATEIKKLRGNNRISINKVDSVKSTRSKSKKKSQLISKLHEQVQIQINIPELYPQHNKQRGKKSKLQPIKRKSALKRTIQARKKRMQSSQILFIINKQRFSHQWQFKTLSKTSKVFNTVISMNSHCDCGHQSKNSICQHLQFFLRQVADLPILLQELKGNKEIKEESYHKLDDALRKRLFRNQGNNHVVFKNKENFEKEADGKCVICFDSLNKKSLRKENAQQNEECQTCSGIFHTSCLEIWKRYHSNCAICQNPIQDEQKITEPIKEFSELTL